MSHIGSVRIVAVLFILILSQTAVSSPLLGVYRWEVPIGPANIDAYSAWLGRPATVAVAFEASDNWDNVDGADWQLGGWSQWVKAQPGRNIALAVPLFPTTVGGSLSSCAAGQYDVYWRNLANNLARYGLYSAYLRLGWEMDGGWYVWNAAPGSGREAAFAGCFRRIVQVMRQTQMGAEWKFVLNPTTNFPDVNYLNAVWPGDAYVDLVGLDLYDQCWVINTYPYPSTCDSACRLARQQNAWDQHVYRLNIIRDFAIAHGKNMALPEWGVAIRGYDPNGGGDNPFFIQKMYDFIHNPANRVEYHGVWDVKAVDINSQLSIDTDMPQSAALFKQLFGAAAPAPAPAPATYTISGKSLSAVSVQQGQTLDVQFTVTSSAAATLQIAPHIYNSSGSIVAKQESLNQVFSAGQSRVYQYRFNISSTLALGTYFVQLGLWDANWNTVLWDSNLGTFSVVAAPAPAPTPTPTLLPDIIVTSVSYDSQTGLFSSVIKNQGAAATPAGVFVGVLYSVDGVGQTWGGLSGSLPAGASATVSTQGGTYMISSGVHTIEAFVDDPNRIAESNENNNKLSASVGAAPPPLSVTVSSKRVSSATVGRDGFVDISFSVTASQAATIHIAPHVYTSEGVQAGKQEYFNQSFSAGQTRSYTYRFQVPSTAALGTYYAQVGIWDLGWTLLLWDDAVGTFNVVAGDLTAPSVSFATPSSGARVSSFSTTYVRVDSSDNVGVQRVEIFLNGTRICTEYTAPYECNVRAQKSSNTLRATAYDAAGNRNSRSITIRGR
jgi:hypothetical protein